MRHSTGGEDVQATRLDRLARLLRVDRTFGVIDSCLAIVAVLMVLSDQLILFLDTTFLLLMLGGCFWRFSGFLARSLLWAGVATAEAVMLVSADVVPASDLLQIPLLVLMLATFYTLASRRNRVERSLTYAGLHDQLTRLPNRACFLRRLEETLSLEPGDRRAVAVISLDIDGFKSVNDAFGHGAGDQVLVVLGERLLRCVRNGDTVARLGGDEFMIAVRTDPGTAPRIAERIAEAVEDPIAIDGAEVRLTASLGVALAEDPSPRLRDDLVRHADAAMRRVKAEGRAGYEVFAPLQTAAA
jgi:diguanylate cyclase (GGDEF)-like protein